MVAYLVTNNFLFVFLDAPGHTQFNLLTLLGNLPLEKPTYVSYCQ